MSGEGDLSGGTGVMDYLQNLYFDTTAINWSQKARFMSRKPQPVTTYHNVVRAFSYPVWIAFTVTLFTLGN